MQSFLQALQTQRWDDHRYYHHSRINQSLHLFFLKDVQTGLVWITKIVTDPFHDIMLYWRAPLFLLKGELIDPMARKGHELEASLSAHDA